MIKNYLLITFRGMLKNKLFISINVLGMGIAIACSMVAYLAFDYDAGFDSVHQNRGSLYRVSALREFDNKITRIGHVALPMGTIARTTLRDVDHSTRYVPSNSTFKRGADLFESHVSYVDPDFFQMFSWEFHYGGPSSMKDKTSVVISEAMAIRLFSSAENAFGKTITQVVGFELKEVKIAGVFQDPPPNSSFHAKEGSAYMNFENYKDEYGTNYEDDWKREGTVFIRVSDANRLTSVERELQQYVENNNRVREDLQVSKFVLDPFTTLAHRDRDDNVNASTWAAPPASAITGSMFMALLLLLIACFNLTNTAIAISSQRLKEIGIRKVMGSRRLQLILQFIGETTCICFLALIVALALADFLISGWNIMTGNNIHLSPDYLDDASFLFFMAGVLVLTGIVAGSYPAFYISKFHPASILKGKLRFGGTNYFTRTLLGLQFAFSLIAIVCAVGFLQNARYQQQYDLGFDIRGSVMVPVNDQHEFDTYRHALQGDPQILSVAGAKTGILSHHAIGAVKFESKQAEVDIIEVGDGYVQTMGLSLLDGRDFIKDSENDQRESVLVTEKMAKLFGWDHPVGKEILLHDSVKFFVVGVVKDICAMGLWREMEPMMIRYVLPDQYKMVVTSAEAKNVSPVDAFMKQQWSKVFPDRLYPGRMLVSDLQQVVDLNLSIMYVYAFLALVAVMLSATGLFTLVSLNLIKRMKEIGVRKVLGASVPNISRIINTEFIIILACASVLGSWISYNLSNVIMSSIWRYYQGVNAMTFICSVGLLFLVSFITIGYKVLTVSAMNPVDILRDE
jgi:ABC-type antimicrobial peptide transport system permease subunit